MASLRSTIVHRSGRFRDLAGWLFVAVAAGAAIASQSIPGEEPAGRAAEHDRPVAQITCASRGGPVWTLAFSSDDRLLASGTLNGELCLVDLATGTPGWTYQGSNNSFQSLSFSPRSRILAVAGIWQAIRFLDTVTGMVRPGPDIGAKFVAFSRDGSLLVAGDYGGSITLWDVAARRRRSVQMGHPGGITALAFAPDDRRFATGGVNGQVKIWDAATGRVLATLDAGGPRAPLMALDFSPDGALLATARERARVIHLWNPATGAHRGAMAASDPGVNALAFAPDGAVLATAEDDGTAALWDATGRHKLGIVRGNDRALIAVAFSHDGRILATGGKDACVRLWNARQVLGRRVAGTAAPDPINPATPR